MGYYTTHTLRTLNSDIRIYDILSKISEDEFEDLFWAIDEHGDTADSCKWYNHENDMKRLSKMFPDAIFDLYGEGEEAGDMWHAYYLNGKTQRCPSKITFDAFDPDKLKEIEDNGNHETV